MCRWRKTKEHWSADSGAQGDAGLDEQRPGEQATDHQTALLTLLTLLAGRMAHEKRKVREWQWRLLGLGAGFGLCVPISQESEGGTEASGSTKTSSAVGEMSKRQATPQWASNGPKWPWLHQAPPHRPLEASQAWLRSTLQNLGGKATCGRESLLWQPCDTR